jgi:hypothetical protein
MLEMFEKLINEHGSSVISWLSVSLLEETGVPGKNH